MPAARVPAPMAGCIDTAMLSTGVSCKTGLPPGTEAVQTVRLASQAAEDIAAGAPVPWADCAGNTPLLDRTAARRTCHSQYRVAGKSPDTEVRLTNRVIQGINAGFEHDLELAGKVLYTPSFESTCCLTNLPLAPGSVRLSFPC